FPPNSMKATNAIVTIIIGANITITNDLSISINHLLLSFDFPFRYPKLPAITDMTTAIPKLIATAIPRMYLHSLIISGGVISSGVDVTGSAVAAKVKVGSTRVNIDNDVAIVTFAIFRNFFLCFLFITSFCKLCAKKDISSMDGSLLLSMFVFTGLTYLTSFCNLLAERFTNIVTFATPS